MTNDRRVQQRITLDKFAFIQIDRDEGGKVFDLSQGGLRFEAFSPQELGRPLYFWFSLDLTERIEGVGEVAWTDATRRNGGLRFISLGQRARALLTTWIDSGSPPNGRNLAHKPPVAPRLWHRDEPSPKLAPLASFVMPRQPALAPPSQPPAADLPPGSKPVRGSQPEPQTGPASLDGAHLVPLERHHSALRRQLIRGVLLGTLLSSVVLGITFKIALGRKDADALRPASEPRAAAVSEKPAETLPTLSVPGPSQSTGPFAPAKAPKFAAPPDNPQQPALAPRRVQAALSSESQAAPQTARPTSDAAKNSTRSTGTPKQLWSAVQAGSAKAAVTLADLYIRGDGVPVNCDQARVLLLFASQRRNADAIKKLQQLDATGCPAPTP